jgi:hypothetical protein
MAVAISTSRTTKTIPTVKRADIDWLTGDPPEIVSRQLHPE